MAENIDHGYLVNIYTTGSIWTLRNNDIYVRENTDVRYATYNTDITTAMRNGANSMSLLFVPLTAYNEETKTMEYELSDNVVIEIEIVRTDFVTQAREVIHAVSLEYDSQIDGFRSLATIPSGQDRVMSSPNMRTVGDYRLSEMQPGQVTFKSGETAGGYRIDFDYFVTSEDIPPFVWEGEATPLVDTPELRQELLRAYQGLHTQIAAGNSEAIFDAAEPVWARAAYLLTTREDARSFANAPDGTGLADRYVAKRPDGSILQPLHFWEGPQTAGLQFMADNHLVRFRPDPIAWENPAGGNLSYHEFPVVFYRTAAGEWKIGAITVGQ